MNTYQNIYLAKAIDLARGAGAILLDFKKNKKKLEVIDKKEEGIATNADLAAEKFILSSLAQNFPKDSILSEEYSFNTDIDKSWPPQNPLWIIDPLDGTNNYFNGLGFYSVSIALASEQGTLLGVVYHPEMDRFYCASKEDGAFLLDRGERRELNRASSSKSFGESLFSPFLGASKGLLTNKDYLSLLKIKDQCRAFRRLGSAALEIAMVASGELDGYWEKGLKPWDMAASAFICEQAGVRVCEIETHDFNPFSSTILCAAQTQFEQLTQLLRRQS